ncbi:uncharacterized protein CDAR_38211 [Caerostris darwini]|uniref:Uncharacterized protein n=1 Tax=Caerostris darwini TaxID=1538125 RepID=A0AAV4TEQ1_9ARAC|nr:uncharacterized protein CDAR_38211 [Caerostris darwini]
MQKLDCQALKFRHEPQGMRCSVGKVVLLPLLSPPEPLQSFLPGESDDPKLFLRMTRKFNSCFQMTVYQNYEMTTYKLSSELTKRHQENNAPTVEVAIIMAGDPVDNRAIKIARHDSTVHVTSCTTISIDILAGSKWISHQH